MCMHVFTRMYTSNSKEKHNSLIIKLIKARYRVIFFIMKSYLGWQEHTYVLCGNEQVANSFINFVCFSPGTAIQNNAETKGRLDSEALNEDISSIFQ